MQKDLFVFISSSRLGNKFPQRSDHLLRALRTFSINIIVIESFNPVFGIIAGIKYRKAKWRIFSGFRAGIAGLLLSFIGFGWVYDLVEVKSKLCNDNWRGIKHHFIPFIAALETLMVKRATLVFAAGSFAYSYAKSIRSDVFLIPNGYDDSLFNLNNFQRDALRDYYRVTFPLAVYIGKLTPMYAKFLVNAIRAMEFVIKEVPDAEFWIFGEGPSKSALEKIANNHVKFKGYIEHNKVPEILTIADVGVHAYDTESLKLIEWLVMGLPTIVPKGLKFDGVIECEWTPEAIAKQLIRIFKSPYRAPKNMPTWRDAAKLILQTLNKANKSE